MALKFKFYIHYYKNNHEIYRDWSLDSSGPKMSKQLNFSSSKWVRKYLAELIFMMGVAIIIRL